MISSAIKAASVPKGPHRWPMAVHSEKALRRFLSGVGSSGPATLLIRCAHAQALPPVSASASRILLGRRDGDVRSGHQAA